MFGYCFVIALYLVKFGMSSFLRRLGDNLTSILQATSLQVPEGGSVRLSTALLNTP